MNLKISKSFIRHWTGHPTIQQYTLCLKIHLNDAINNNKTKTIRTQLNSKTKRNENIFYFYDGHNNLTSPIRDLAVLRIEDFFLLLFLVFGVFVLSSHSFYVCLPLAICFMRSKIVIKILWIFIQQKDQINGSIFIFNFVLFRCHSCILKNVFGNKSR